MRHEDVVAHVRDLLVEGRIAPGERVPERALCESLGISRTPLREALKVLAAEGHVVLLQNRGARAARLTHRDVRELFEVSAALEATAGELACQRITDTELAEIARLQSGMEAAYATSDLPEYYKYNRAIHEAIMRAADNGILASLYEGISTRVRRARFQAPMNPEHWRLAVQEHAAILNALQRHDGPVLSLILKAHLRRKGQEVERAGFIEDDTAAIVRPPRKGRRSATQPS